MPCHAIEFKSLASLQRFFTTQVALRVRQIARVLPACAHSNGLAPETYAIPTRRDTMTFIPECRSPDVVDARLISTDHHDIPVTAASRVDAAIHGLSRSDPDASAALPLVAWQRHVLILAVLATPIWLATGSRVPLLLLFGLATLSSLAILLLRLIALREIGHSQASLALVSAPAAEREPVELPLYSILVPLYREATVIPQLLAALDALDYPKHRLDVLLIVEFSDPETTAAIARAAPGPHIRTIVVPDGLPRTKPKALNFGMTYARGDYVVVFDAEDQPEPDQLRQALQAFRGGPPALGCVQARLNIYNPASSWLTRQFTMEYSALFDGLLPAMERARLPIMLGGTSNHFRREVLEAVECWDAFNVTEDADLGLRLARRGYLVAVLPSTTWEEAPPTYRIWHGQRTRWLKGWLQTYIVHMRRPARLWQELGPRRFVAFQALTGGALLSALVHPLFLAILLIEAAAGTLLAGDESMVGSTLRWLALLNVVASYGVAMVLGYRAVAARGRRWLGWHIVLLPIYWLAISLAAYAALWQLFRAPFHWEKTAHSGRAPAMEPEA